MEYVLASGHVMLVDEADVPLLAQYQWKAHRYGDGLWYATATSTRPTLYAHRFITEAQRGWDVDHINGNGLDNRRSNLRVVPHRLNLANQRPQLGRSSRFKGVSYFKSGNRIKRWVASIKVDGRKSTIGYFLNEEEAARAYDQAAIAAWGEHARPNFPEVAA
jgi:hypothetical protein